MKVLKIIGIIILVIVILGAGVVIFGPSETHMERSITIDAPVEAVFDEVNGFKTFDQFSAWSAVDTTAKIIIEGPTAGVGASYSWQSDNPDLGTGSIEIIESDQNMMIKSKMRFEGYPGEPTASWILSEEDGKTKVIYTYDETDISGIMKLFALGTESMLSPMYDETLQKLKTRVESRPDFTYDIEEVETTAQPYIGVKASSSSDPAEIGEVMGQAYGQIGAYMANNKVAMAGAPISIVLSYDEQETEMICGIPTESVIEVQDDNIISEMTYAGKALKTIHMGDYALMESAYENLVDYMSYYGYEANGNPWEVYPTDPTLVPDTAQWRTEIYFPIK
ncbi:SRPBCC family protein [Ekhidna sp.]|uniref:SRPBCC family protein n=1 Tax=Ekhidna sp. TaxID=2608089 RepID=UPI00329686D9